MAVGLGTFFPLSFWYGLSPVVLRCWRELNYSFSRRRERDHYIIVGEHGRAFWRGSRPRRSLPTPSRLWRWQRDNVIPRVKKREGGRGKGLPAWYPSGSCHWLKQSAFQAARRRWTRGWTMAWRVATSLWLRRHTYLHSQHALLLIPRSITH